MATKTDPICLHCKEPVLDLDQRAPVDPPMHYECGLRLAVGSIAHLDKRCDCFIPGSEKGDPSYLSIRQAAQLAACRWQMMNPIEKEEIFLGPRRDD
jgi:hypothetical protein